MNDSPVRPIESALVDSVQVGSKYRLAQVADDCGVNAPRFAPNVVGVVWAPTASAGAASSASATISTETTVR